MSHVRTQIRDAVVSRLSVELPNFAGRVHAQRILGFTVDDVADGAIAVDVKSTTAQPASGASGGPRLQSRQIAVEVTIIRVLDGDVATRLDEDAVLVEAAMAKFGFGWGDVQYAGDTYEAMPSRQASEGDLAALTLKYLARVASREGHPDKPLRT